MTAAVGFPTLRLVRWSMEKINIAGFESGEVREMDQKSIYHQLGLTGFAKTGASGMAYKHCSGLYAHGGLGERRYLAARNTGFTRPAP